MGEKPSHSAVPRAEALPLGLLSSVVCLHFAARVSVCWTACIDAWNFVDKPASQSIDLCRNLSRGLFLFGNLILFCNSERHRALGLYTLACARE